MEVLPAWLDSVGMLLILELDRNRNQSPVAHTALGNDTPGEVPHIARGTFQNGDFQTTVVVQMHVRRCHRQIMAVVERSRQSLRQLPLPMIINMTAQMRRRLSKRGCWCLAYFRGEYINCICIVSYIS